MTFKDLWELLQETWNAWSTHRAPRSGAALAYYTIFSLAPLLAQNVPRCTPTATGHVPPGDGPSLPALAGSDEHDSGYVSSTRDTSTVRTQKGKMRP